MCAEVGAAVSFCFVNHAGVQPGKLPQSLGKDYDIVLPEHRKVMAPVLKPDEQEKVATFMKHSLATQQRYYRAQKDSVEVVELLNSKLLPPCQPEKLQT